MPDEQRPVRRLHAEQRVELQERHPGEDLRQEQGRGDERIQEIATAEASAHQGMAAAVPMTVDATAGVQQAIGTPKSRAAAAEYLRQFVEDVKASGFVAEAIAKNGVEGVAVAPPASAQP